MKGARSLLAALGAALGLALHASAADPSALHRAAALYHQDRFDSARAGMESLLAEPGWRRRDSLVLLQYLGMASSRLGRDSAAVARFGRLLELDSLFQFPRNENPDILRNFGTALAARHGSSASLAGTGAAGRIATPDIRKTAGVEQDPGIPGTGETEGAEGAPAEPRPGAPGASAFADPLSAALSAGSAGSGMAPRRRMSLALGAVPLGGGWLMRERTGHGLTLGLLQGGGVLLSLYASKRQSSARDDRWGVEEGREEDAMVRWQWVQAVSLSTAVGAYLYSIFASGGG